MSISFCVKDFDRTDGEPLGELFAVCVIQEPVSSVMRLGSTRANADLKTGERPPASSFTTFNHAGQQ